jgi:hypothetical protein
MKTIYLSSTYEDLKDYRQAVLNALRKSGYSVIAMEDYDATDRRLLRRRWRNSARLSNGPCKMTRVHFP